MVFGLISKHCFLTTNASMTFVSRAGLPRSMFSIYSRKEGLLSIPRYQLRGTEAAEFAGFHSLSSRRYSKKFLCPKVIPTCFILVLTQAILSYGVHA